eukprot:2173778-Pyramimonas_sp.AAC.1
MAALNLAALASNALAFSPPTPLSRESPHDNAVALVFDSGPFWEDLVIQLDIASGNSDTWKYTNAPCIFSASSVKFRFRHLLQKLDVGCSLRAG